MISLAYKISHCLSANHNPELRCVICTGVRFERAEFFLKMNHNGIQHKSNAIIAINGIIAINAMSSACSFILMQISHFHKNGFALGLALKQRHKGTRKWPISFSSQRSRSFWSAQRFATLGRSNFLNLRRVIVSYS